MKNNAGFNTNAILKHITDHFSNTLKETSRDLLNDAKNNTPIDSGNLKSSYIIDLSKDTEVKIINDATNPETGEKYAHQLLVLGRTGFGKGSLMLPNGILPVMENFLRSKSINYRKF